MESPLQEKEKTKEFKAKKKEEEKKKKRKVKEIESFLKSLNSNNYLHKIFTSTVFFDFMTFVVTGISVAFIVLISESQDILVLNNKPSRILFSSICFGLLLIVAIIIFFYRNRTVKKRLEGFKKINEIMSSSFHIIFNYFIDNMMLIKETSSKEKLKGYLKLFDEKELFKKLAETLSNFLENLFSRKLNTKIDIFKFDDGKLEPIMDTFINGAFRDGIRPATFEVPERNVNFSSLAAFTFCTNSVGYIRNIEEIQNMLDSLEDEHYIQRIRNEKNIYFEKREETLGFVLGTILCFPLIYNGNEFGVLSIGFNEQNIEPHLIHLGITIEDFKNCIEIFIKRYTKFSVFTSQGIKNLIVRFDRESGREERVN